MQNARQSPESRNEHQHSPPAAPAAAGSAQACTLKKKPINFVFAKI